MTHPTITPEEALAKVKEALIISKGYASRHLCVPAEEALALIPIIEGAMLPEFSKGMSITITDCYDVDENTGERINGYECIYSSYTGHAETFGKTPRAAIIAAKGKVQS